MLCSRKGWGGAMLTALLTRMSMVPNFGQVRGDGQHFSTIFLAQLGGSGQFVCGTGADGEVRPLRREAQGDLLAQTYAAAGDDGDFPESFPMLIVSFMAGFN